MQWWRLKFFFMLSEKNSEFRWLKLEILYSIFLGDLEWPSVSCIQVNHHFGFDIMMQINNVINRQLKNRFDQIHFISCILQVMYRYLNFRLVKTSHKRKIWKTQIFTGLLFNCKLLSFNSPNQLVQRILPVILRGQNVDGLAA